MNNTDKPKTLLVIVLGFLVLYFIFDVKTLLYVSASIGVVSLLIPPVGDLIIKLWFLIAKVLGWFNSRLLLSIVFFIFLLPISLFSRLFSKNPLQIKNTGNTLYITKNHKYTKADLENMW